MLHNPTTEMLTLDEVAEELNVAKSSVEEWVYDRSLESFTKGRLRRVSRESLTKFVLLNTMKPKRPDWLTAEIESRFTQQLRQIVASIMNEKVAA